MVTALGAHRVVVPQGGAAWVVLNKYRCDLGSHARVGEIELRLAGAGRIGAVGPNSAGWAFCGSGDPGSIVHISPFEPRLLDALRQHEAAGTPWGQAPSGAGAGPGSGGPAIPAARDVEHRAPAPPEQPVGPLAEPAPDLGVQALALPRGHRDVARERVEQRDVAVRVVDDLPVVLLDAAPRRRARSPRSRRGRRAARRAAARPHPAEAPRRSRRRHPGARGRRGRHRRGRRGPPSRRPGARRAEGGRTSCDSGRRDRSSARTSPRRPGRTARRPGGRHASNDDVHDLDVRILGEGGPRTGREPRPELDARDPKAAVGQRPGRLARAGPDLEHPVAARHARLPHEVVEELRRIVGPGPFVGVCGGVERRRGLPRGGGYSVRHLGEPARRL